MEDRRTERVPRGTRVLFLAWGYSVHAERAIRSFAEDPDFAVAIVSNHPYDIANARTAPLLGDAAKKEVLEALVAREKDVRDMRDRGGFLDRAGWRIEQARRATRVGRLLSRIGVRDIGILRKVMNSLDLLYEMDVAGRDLAALSAAVREFRPDVILLQTLLYPSYLACMLPGKRRIVVTIWNGDAMWWAEWTGIEKLLKKRIVARGLRTADAVTVNSRASRDACCGHGARREAVHLIASPGVDLSRFRPADRGRSRDSLGVAARKVVLCPRGLGGYLNSDVIVEAAALVAARCPDVLFLFVSGVGQGAELERHQERARALGIDGKCRWEGQVPWDAMPSYYNAADVMVSISSRDSLPTCMLEAMACEVPVVMGDIPPVREWVDDGVTGFLVPTRSPEALAARIREVLDAPPEAIGPVTRRSLERVRDEADGGKNEGRVKDLVRRVAGAGGRR